jgi:hypothetical protein
MSMALIYAILLYLVFLSVLITGIYFWMKPVQPAPPVALVVAVFGGVAILVGGCVLCLGHYKVCEYKTIACAMRGEMPEDGDIAAAIGTIVACEGILNAPLTGRECVYYRYEMEHEERDHSEDDDTTTVTDYSGDALAPCAVRTSFGDVNIEGRPAELRGFRVEIVKDHARADEYIRTTEFQEFNLDDPFQAIPFAREVYRSLGQRGRKMRSDYRLSDATDSSGLWLKEWILPAQVEVCAIGRFDASGTALYNAPQRTGHGSAIQIIKGNGAAVLRSLWWTAALLIPGGILLLIGSVAGLIWIRRKLRLKKYGVHQNRLPAVAG